MSFGLLEEKRVNIIIVGSGKVGYTLAQHLNAEGHEITVIDSDEEKIKDLSSEMDIYCVLGNGTSYRTQKEAGIEKADLLISVANQDEVNLLSCLIAKKAGNCQTIARVRNPEYYDEIGYIREELGLSMSINPEWEAANEMARLIQYPSALAVEKFRGGMTLLRVVIPEKSVLNGMSVAEFAVKISRQILVCIVKRGKEIRIPDGNFVLMAGDAISVSLPIREATPFFKKIGVPANPIKSVMVAGGGMISFYLAKILQDTGVEVKIIEENKKRCEELSEALPHAMIIQGEAIDKELLLEEEIRETDAFAAMTDIDEENIMLSLYAKKVSHAKTMTKIDKIEFPEVVDDLGIDSLIVPKVITGVSIIRYVRAMQNTMGSNVQTLYRMIDGRVEALEFIVSKTAKVTNKPICELKIKKNLLICSIQRKGKLITPSGNDMLQCGDSVIIVTTNLGLDDIDDILEG